MGATFEWADDIGERMPLSPSQLLAGASDVIYVVESGGQVSQVSDAFELRFALLAWHFCRTYEDSFGVGPGGEAVSQRSRLLEVLTEEGCTLLFELKEDRLGGATRELHVGVARELSERTRQDMALKDDFLAQAVEA